MVTFSLLIAVTVLLFLVMAGVSFLLFELVLVSAVVTGAWTGRTSRAQEGGSSLLRYRDRRHLAVLLAYTFLKDPGFREATFWLRFCGI